MLGVLWELPGVALASIATLSRALEMNILSVGEQLLSFWILRWKWLGDHRRPVIDFCHLLPFRWGTDRVREYVKALYANFEYPDRLSALAVLEDRKFWSVRLRDDGNLITTYTNPCLEAHRVDDLTVEYDERERKEILRWTCPQRYEFVSYPTGSRLEPVGEPRQEIYEHVLPFLPTQG